MSVLDVIREQPSERRQQQIVDVLVDAFSDLMEASPTAFRRKFRKMASEPFAFYRGTACLFYADMADDADPWADEHTGRIWIQGDLHAENFGTYLDGTGVFIFDVNDFDEAYLGHFTWDIKRLVASVALLSWAKAISDRDIALLIEAYVRAYINQVHYFVRSDRDHQFSLRLETTHGAIHDVLRQARLATRVEQLDKLTVVEDYDRRFRHQPGVRQLATPERQQVEEAFARYLETIPPDKRLASVSYTIKDIVGSSGFGIGSAGLPAYTILVEGPTQALENDAVLSMKQGNVAAPSRILHDDRVRGYFLNHGHRTAVSQRALQAHADPWLGHTRINDVGFSVRELSPYEEDLNWDALTEPSEMAPVLTYLGEATAKMHCVSDSDSDHTLVDFQTEDAIAAVLDGREEKFIHDMTEFGMAYAQVARDDWHLFVDAFRNGMIPGVESSAKPV